MNKTDKNIFAEVIDSLTFEIAQSNRTSMINAIFEYAGDEYESIESVKELAKKTDEQLRFVLKSILDYYVNENLSKNIDKDIEHKTNVIFYIEKPEGDLNCNCFAYFPNDKYSNSDDIFTGYAHIGQHTGIHKDYANECKKATPEEYEDLQKELTKIGYNLNILNQ